MSTPSKLQRRMNRTGSNRSTGLGSSGGFGQTREQKQQGTSGRLEDLDVQRLLAAYSNPQQRPNFQDEDDYPNVSIEGDGLKTAICGVSASFFVTDSSVATQSVQAYALHAVFKIKAECTSVCVSPGRWKLSYVVTTAGTWSLYVYVCGSAGQMPVQTSPFSVSVMPNVVSPQTCILDGPGLHQAKQAEQNTLLLTLVDAYGNIVNGRDYTLRVALSDCRFEYNTHWQADGKVEISYTPLVRKHTSVNSVELTVSVDNHLVQGGAFHVPYYCTPEQVEEELGHILKTLADVREFLHERRTSGWVRRKKRMQWKQTYLRIILDEHDPTPQLFVTCFSSEDASTPTEKIPLLDTIVKPFSLKRMLAGQLEGFTLRHGNTTIEFGCVSQADRDEWCEIIQAMIKFSSKYLGLENINSQVEHKESDGGEPARGYQSNPSFRMGPAHPVITESESKDDTSAEKFIIAPRAKLERKPSAPNNDTFVHKQSNLQGQRTTRSVERAIEDPRHAGAGMSRTQSTLSQTEVNSPRARSPPPGAARRAYTAASTDSTELRRAEATRASVTTENQRPAEQTLSSSKRASSSRELSSTSDSNHYNREVASVMPDHDDDLEDFFLPGNSALLANGHTPTSTMEQKPVTAANAYIRASFLDPSKDARIATPDQSPERRRGQVDKMDSLQADAAQWNRVTKWLKSIGQTKYAENFKRHGLVQLAIIELVSTQDLIDIGVEEEDRTIILEEIVKFSSSTMRWASKAMQDDSLSRTSSRTTVLADPLQNELLAYFDAHNKEAFFSLWQTVVPVESLRSADHILYQTTRSLEFYLHVYFAICPVLEGAGEAKLQEAMMAFRSYVEAESRKGGLLAQSADFAAYAGLFLVPQPDKNPAYKGLFQEEWTASLRERVQAYLAVVLGRSEDTDWGEHPLSPPKQKMLQFDPTAVNLPTRPLSYATSPEQGRQQNKHSKATRDAGQTPSRRGRAQTPRDRNTGKSGITSTRTSSATKLESGRQRYTSQPRQAKPDGTSSRRQNEQGGRPGNGTSSPSKTRRSANNIPHRQLAQSRTPHPRERTALDRAQSPTRTPTTPTPPNITRGRTTTRHAANPPTMQRMRVGTIDSRTSGYSVGETDDISKLRAMIQAKRRNGVRTGQFKRPAEAAFLDSSTPMTKASDGGATWYDSDTTMYSNHTGQSGQRGRKPHGSRFDHWSGNQLTSVL